MQSSLSTIIMPLLTTALPMQVMVIVEVANHNLQREVGDKDKGKIIM